MPVGKNSLARAAKQVSEAKQKETVAQPSEATKKAPAPKKTKPKAIPLEVLSEKVPADETSRPAISPVSAVNVTPDHLPAIDVSDTLSLEAAPTKKTKKANKKPSPKSTPKASATSVQTPAEPTADPQNFEKHALGEDLPYYLL